MRLTVYNGSPRGVHSNTKVLLNHFLAGFVETPSNSSEVAYLINRRRSQEHVRLFGEAEHVLIAFPLYYDSMPAPVKDFIEELAPFRGRIGNPSLRFIVQSGFIESIHSLAVERYLARLAIRLGCEYKGTVIRGGGEAIRIVARQRRFLEKLIVKFSSATDIAGVGHCFDIDELCGLFYRLGKIFGETGMFDQEIVAALARPRKISRLGYWFAKTAVNTIYWDQMLKSHDGLPTAILATIRRVTVSVAKGTPVTAPPNQRPHDYHVRIAEAGRGSGFAIFATSMLGEIKNRWSTICRPNRYPVYKKAGCTNIRISIRSVLAGGS